MENRDFIEINYTEKTELKPSENKTEKVLSGWKIVIVISIIFCLGVIFLFFCGQIITFRLTDSIEHDIFGAFGDFIGGFLGTIIALYSVYLLIKTFQNQSEINENIRKTNQSVVDTNGSIKNTNDKLINQTELQIFDSRFSKLLDLYKDAINFYGNERFDNNGRLKFEAIVEEFKKKGLLHKTEYKRRSISAVSEYYNLYTINRQNFSVHFRMLYLLTKLTAEEKIHESYRVSYAKTIRGQLSEGELLLLRYNCLSIYGVRMRTYVNKFNLIKHLPIMSLLEFTKWKNIIQDTNLINSIDQLFINLKKKMTGMLDNDGEVLDKFKISSRVSFEFMLNNNHDTFLVLLRIQKKKIKGGAIKRPYEEILFDKIETKDLPIFLQEIFTEMFIYSNFFQFNGEDNHIVKAKINNDKTKELELEIKIERSGKPLALAERQLVPSR